MIRALTAALCLGFAPMAWAASIEGIRVGDNLINVAPRLGHPSDFDTATGATLLAWDLGSVRLSLAVVPGSREIVSVEELGGDAAQPPPAMLGGLVLGKTTLGDIRSRFGSDGFTFASNAKLERDGKAVMVRCYGLRQPANVVLAVITGASAPGADAASSVLHGVILADMDYLKQNWGSEGAADPAYHPIDLP